MYHVIRWLAFVLAMTIMFAWAVAKVHSQTHGPTLGPYTVETKYQPKWWQVADCMAHVQESYKSFTTMARTKAEAEELALGDCLAKAAVLNVITERGVYNPEN